MLLTTSKDKEYTVDWIGGPTTASGSVILEFQSTRKLYTIAKEFDELEWLKCGDSEYVGYTVLMSISRVSDGVVRIKLAKEN